ncbi:MAG TPA: hypothetical protein VK699_04530 [Terriglobales bacterium]|nr:hypothetical protein [Terriglobales bacterium]
MALRIYFDGSGKEEHPVLTVGGYMASDKKCEAIEDAWDEIVGDGLFHLADFGTKSCTLGSGEWDVSQRVAFLKRLSGIVNQSLSPPLSISVETEQYRKFVAGSGNPHVYGPAYSGCAQLCFALAEYVLDINGWQNEEVAYTFELGDRQHEISKSFYEYVRPKPIVNKRSIHFLPKETVLLQPSDLIAGKIQEVLMRAYSDLGTVEIMDGHICIDEFKKYYSYDGTSLAVLDRPNGKRPLCFVVSKSKWEESEPAVTKIFELHPNLLAKRLKHVKNQGKRRRKPSV